MADLAQDDIEDLAESAAAGRRPRDSGPYRVRFGDEELNYRPGIIADPVPTGQQLLEASGVHPTIDYAVYQLLTNGLLESIRPDETTDLRTSGVERFLILRGDASYRFVLDDRQFEWGAKFISGGTLKKLAGVDLQTYGVWLEVRGAEDRPLGDGELLDLSKPGVERLFTGINATTEG